MKEWTEQQWKEFDELVATARSRYEQHAKGQREKAPGAFQALDMIYNHLPNVNPTLAALVFGWIEGSFRRAELPEHTYDSEAEAWYIHVTHDDVHHTTETVTNVDWAADGNLVGVELLPGAPRLLLKPNPNISDDELEAMKLRIEEAMKQPVMQHWLRPEEDDSLQRGIADVEAGRVEPLPWVTKDVEAERVTPSVDETLAAAEEEIPRWSNTLKGLEDK